MFKQTLFFALFLAVAPSVSGQTNQAAFFRISSPSGAVITDFDPVSGTISWSNEVAGVTNQLQRAYTLNNVSSWVDYVQLISPGGTVGTEHIIGLYSSPGMVLVPGGIQCGTNPLVPGEEGYNDLNYPSNYCLAVNAFYMDSTEVTNDKMIQVLQWAYDNGKLIVSSASVVNEQGNRQELLDIDSIFCSISWNGSAFQMRPDKKGSGYPCVEVSWYGAAAYCNYRSGMEGRSPCYDLTDWSCDHSAGGYRLPTDTEWEMAARGGLNSRRFPWGDTISHNKANYVGNSSAYSFDDSDGHHPLYNDGFFPYLSPVGSFAPNGYGLYDMAGNVWEWSHDWLPGYESARILNGGAYSAAPIQCRVGYRSHRNKAHSTDSIGFRTVISIE